MMENARLSMMSSSSSPKIVPTPPAMRRKSSNGSSHGSTSPVDSAIDTWRARKLFPMEPCPTIIPRLPSKSPGRTHRTSGNFLMFVKSTRRFPGGRPGSAQGSTMTSGNEGMMCSKTPSAPEITKRSLKSVPPVCLSDSGGAMQCALCNFAAIFAAD
ncbi:MAG: hypothetical protein DDT34_02423 [Firmicutes bacterium]|nr:hypothetical protein [Bacillota bacterium]